MTQGSAGLSFELVARDGEARTGRLGTAHGIVRTPAFMPVGTAATVKAMTPSALKQTGAEIVLANTYHLMLRPGAETIAALGGLHRFMNWDGPLLTDSGGYQVMSLASLRELSAHGVVFRSHLDGSRHELSPERCIEIQGLLGVDIAMALDECTPFPVTEDQARDSMRLTLAWAERCLAALGGDRAPGALIGIVQGGVFPALRAECAARLVDMNFDGYALGGLAVGEGTDAMLRVVADTAPQLPAHKPRYLMGVGKPADVVAAVARGIDLFDCVLPTRSGRTGQAFTRRGPVALRNARHAADARPLDSTCSCPTCTGHSRAYLHHLFRAREMLGPILLTRHNLTYYQDLMADLRAAIEVGGFAAFADTFSTEQARGDIGAP